MQKKKISENKRILKRNFDHLCKVIPILKPKTVLPFAGSYVLGGKNISKNNYLGTTTWDVCAAYLKKNLKVDVNVICLRENQIFDILNQKSLSKYIKLSKKNMKEYIKKIKKHKYDYELDKNPNIRKLKSDILIASGMFKKKVNKFGTKIKSNVYIKINSQEIQIYDGLDKDKKIVCKMETRLLRRILDRKSHWNNAEIGAHISFFRSPNKMEPDLHTLLSFFHL